MITKPDTGRELYRPIPTPLYAIQVPSGSDHKVRRLMELCAKLAGGCSRRTVNGVWTDDKIGQTIWEPITELQFACEAGAYAAILYEAMILYPNEHAFFVARIGTAEVIQRGEYIARAGVRATVDEVSRADFCKSRKWDVV